MINFVKIKELCNADNAYNKKESFRNLERSINNEANFAKRCLH